MRLARIAIANVDTKVLDVDGNLQLALDHAKRAEEAHCHVVAYPEQTFGGYPAEDNTLRLDFVRRQLYALCTFARLSHNMGSGRAVHVVGVTIEHGGDLFNCAAVVCGGKILGLVPKEKLPTYGVFYEIRTTSSGIAGRISQFSATDEKGELIVTIPFGDLVFDIKNLGRMAVVTCEDIWDPNGPLYRRTYKGAELVVAINSSPFRAGVNETRREMLATRSADHLATLVYANQVGGNDNLAFDGGGFVFQCGRLMYEAPRWQHNQLTHTVVDLDVAKKARMANTTWRLAKGRFIEANHQMPHAIDAGDHYPLVERHSNKMQYPFPKWRNFFLPGNPNDPKDAPKLAAYFEDLLTAMEMGLEDYFRKTRAFDCLLISLSGGYDSALALIIARRIAQRRFADLTGEEKAVAIRIFVRCYGQPSQNNTQTTNSIARQLASDFGASFTEYPVEEAAVRETEAAKAMRGGKEPLQPITLQNIQARVRGQRMWNLANELRGCWIQTGSMTEKLLGFMTVGGDQMGCYAPMGNLPKTVEMYLLRWLREMQHQDAQGLGMLLATAPSPGLAPNQTTEDDLMPFPVADACMALYLGHQLTVGETIEVVHSMWSPAEFLAMDPKYNEERFGTWMFRFFRKFQLNIYKWVWSAMATHLGSLDLDRERCLQLPVAHKPVSGQEINDGLKAIEQRVRT